MSQSQEVFDKISILFQQRVEWFMKKSAIDVMAEAYGGVGEPSIEDHALRVTYASKVLDGTASVRDYAIAVSTNGAIAAAMDGSGNQSDVTDNDLGFTVNSMFDAFSGVDGEAT